LWRKKWGRMNTKTDIYGKRLINLANSFIFLNTLGWLVFFLINYIARWQYINTLDQYLGFSSYYVVGYFVCFILRIFYRRLNIRVDSLVKVGIYLIITSYVFGVLWFMTDLAVSILMFGFDRYKEIFAFRNLFVRSLLPWIIMIMWSALFFVVKYWREWNKEKDRAMEAEILLHESELKLLRYQLNPHFLFNSLNSIRALTLKDPSLVRDMVTELSEFLKYSLLSKNKQEVPLKEEIKSIKHYFRIEKYRFQDNFTVEYSIDKFAEEFPVPVMLIHPIVENAVKYGMATSEMPLQIFITGRVDENQLTLEVKNSGSWAENIDKFSEKLVGTNTGLENVRRRLENSYPGSYTFSIIKNKNEVVVQIKILRKPDIENGEED
jgi:two-component system, LytTR family, sensor kinase